MSTAPYFDTFTNPAHKPGGFSHYEIQTVREHFLQDGSTFMAYYGQPSEDEDAMGPVIFGIYGHHDGNDGQYGVEHIADRPSLAQALDLLRRMGVATNDSAEDK